ncbi:ammonium transporter [Streptomyces sp. NPDC087844]|uniref:ammonium transporter n=1 Tax=Streptomyces sp. NPDC087844 TaxID=3365805 RepID=UPI00382EDA11
MTLAAASLDTGDTAWLLGGVSEVPHSTHDARHAGMAGLGPDSVQGTVPTLLFATFQLTFAIITAALVGGAVADRAKFGAWLVFVPLWALLVYVPVAHWVWGPGGWILKDLGALDFAGGLPVEIVSGASGLALCLVLGSRLGFKKDAMRPHNLPMVMLGAGLLRFGWFGFNAGSASGAVAGLVAITPSCGSVSLLGALVIGLAAGVVCSYAVGWKFRFGYDDSLDVVGVHLVGGVIGTLLIGVFATGTMTGGAEGLLYGGGLGQLGRQLVAILTVGAYAFAVTYGVAELIDRVVGLRADEEHEQTGLDLTVHAGTAYDHGVLGHGAPVSASVLPTAQKARPQA